jgi:hypothetical protein
MGNNVAYTAGHFELSLDGAKTSAYLKSLDGGYMSHSLVSERIGSENKPIQHAAVADVNPISFEVGMSGAGSVLQWIQDSWNKNYQQRSGQINHANFNMERVFEHEFSDALITETTFPTLDGASKEAAYLKVKFQPRAVASRKASGSKLLPGGGTKQKSWLCSSFRFSIDGIDDAIYVNKIESFTIKQGIKKMTVGKFRDIVEVAPTKIEWPMLSATIALEKADGILAWYDEYIVKGKKDPTAQKQGSIEFLSPDRSKTLFRITLWNMGIVNAQLPQSTANADAIKRLKFELYVSEMQLDGPGALGLE